MEIRPIKKTITFLKSVKEYFKNRPVLRKVTGVLLIIIGIIVMIVPVIPGAWIVFIGLGLLGIRLIFIEQIRRILDKLFK